MPVNGSFDWIITGEEEESDLWTVDNRCGVNMDDNWWLDACKYPLESGRTRLWPDVLVDRIGGGVGFPPIH